MIPIEAIIQIAVQVPAMAIMGYVLMRVLDRVLDMRAQERERFAVAIEHVADAVRELRAWVAPPASPRRRKR